MYTIFLDSGEVMRISDSKIVAPAQDENDLDFIEYKTWIAQGNSPTVGSTSAAGLSEQKIDKWRLIQIERDRRKAGGVQVGANWFHSDDTSRIQFIGLLLYGANMPANIMWKTMSGSFVQMTPTLAQQIFGSIAAKDTLIFTIAETHKAQVYASSTPGVYNIFNGSPAWPLIYGE
jgi:hypothetical protein